MQPHTKIILFLICCLSIGCASTNFSNTTIKYPMPNDGISVENNKIRHNGKLFAELRFYFTVIQSENFGETYLFSSEAQHRGLAIYYRNRNKLVWIFPKDGRQADIERGYFIARGQTDGYVGWVYDVRISDDGRYVYYKKPGLKSTTAFIFSIEHGVSMKLN